MLIDPESLRNNLDRLEEIEKASLRLVDVCLDLFVKFLTDDLEFCIESTILLQYDQLVFAWLGEVPQGQHS